mgnify:FL=1
MDYLDILKQYWGYSSFRGIQQDIIESIGSGKDTLGLMPTGGGKSITFQVPTMAMDGVCLVITPLIALMKDQVRNLRDKGIKAAAIYTGMRRDQIIATMENCVYGNYKFLYISPERLSSELFLAKLRYINVCLITVDESHCISQWGYDFRPAYLNIADIRKSLPTVPVLALTATATPRVTDDIQDKLGFKEKNLFRMSFVRENLSYVVRDTENKYEELKHILSKVAGSGIVYVRNRKETKEIAEYLNSIGISSTFYHAGLDPEIKDKRQQEWTENLYRIVVATNAFGMGIDKPDVRVVIHIDMPDSIEAYFQEAGRAGRDGRRSYAILLHSPGDKRLINKRISDHFPEKKFITTVYEKLAYYYEMAMGDGQGCTYGFSLADFCEQYALPIIPTESALRILTRMGYIEYIDEIDYSARLRITSTREELYRTKEQDTTNENILNIVLRHYSGLFSDEVFIDEKFIYTQAGITKRELYKRFIDMQHQGILKYVPSRRTPVITWKKNRVETDMLNFADDIYTDRKQEYIERIGSIREYTTRRVGCRSAILLDYFGEKQNKPCMHCDLCLEKDSSGIKKGEFKAISQDIEDMLSQKEGTTDNIYSLPYEKNHIESVLHRLAEEEIIYMTEGKLTLNKRN